jgi:hypothetical protein
MDEIEHVNPKRHSKRLSAHAPSARADGDAMHRRAASLRHVDRPKADAQALGRVSRDRRTK